SGSFSCSSISLPIPSTRRSIPGFAMSSVEARRRGGEEARGPAGSATSPAKDAQSLASTPSRLLAFRRYPALFAGLAIVLVLIVLALPAPLLAQVPPNKIDTTAVLAGVSWEHPFGTDNLGRDLLSRVLYGYRLSLSIAFAATIASLAVGVPLGLAAGYAGGW